MSGSSWDVIVVGAGVSGCATAGRLASAGARVLLVSASLDSVGMAAGSPWFTLPVDPPYFGAVSDPEAVSWEADRREGSGGQVLGWFSRFPAGLALAWLAETRVPLRSRDENGVFPAGMVVDRRMLSIRTKAWLESLPTLELRQALVTGVGRRGGMLVAHTAFGEELRSRSLVLAVGLSLRGRHEVAGFELSGARPGEVPADGLAVELEEALGVGLERRQTQVGERIRLGLGRNAGGPKDVSELGEMRFGSRIAREIAVQSNCAVVELAWVRRAAKEAQEFSASGVSGLARILASASAVPAPQDVGLLEGGILSGGDRQPPSPYEELADPGFALVCGRESLSEADVPTSDLGAATQSRSGDAPRATGEVMGLLPDGYVTGEWYVAPEARESVLTELEARGIGVQVSRSSYTSRGEVIPAGALRPDGGVRAVPGLFVTGAAAGMTTYGSKLEDAARVSGSVQAFLDLPR
ncbi:MAG: hypothetical protein Kow00129_14840 [Thermoleophilia bacterium]